jgi:hypothetical protein
LKGVLATAAAILPEPAFTCGQAVPGQPPKAIPESGGEAVFTSETRLVPLNVTVNDKSGHLVPNLPRSAFQILENGVPQQIKDFKHEDVPVSLGLIIDSSGNMRDKR